jgi:DNA repair protein RadC
MARAIAVMVVSRVASTTARTMSLRARLREVDGIGESAINQLKLIAASRVTRGGVNSRNARSSWNEVIEYCRSSMAFADKEQFRLLFLDKRNTASSASLFRCATKSRARNPSHGIPLEVNGFRTRAQVGAPPNDG